MDTLDDDSRHVCTASPNRWYGGSLSERGSSEAEDDKLGIIHALLKMCYGDLVVPRTWLRYGKTTVQI
jgi:hypothetical protein